MLTISDEIVMNSCYLTHCSQEVKVLRFHNILISLKWTVISLDVESCQGLPPSLSANLECQKQLTTLRTEQNCIPL